MDGKGNFSSGYLTWKMNSTKLDVKLKDGDNYLILSKHKEAETSFEDGFIINIQETKPEHVQFYFSSSQKDKEDTNLRLKSSQVSMHKFQTFPLLL